MKRELIGNQVFRAVIEAVHAVASDVMSVVMSRGASSGRWFDDVQALDRRPLIRGLSASGAVR